MLRTCIICSVVGFLLCANALGFCSVQTPARDDPRQLGQITELVAQRQWRSAVARVAEYRRLYPDSATAPVLQAEILIHLGLLSDASDVLEHALMFRPRSVPALTASAELSRQLGDKAAAEELLLRCTRYSPNDPEVWKRLGDFYVSASRKEALTAFRHALRLVPEDATALAGLAETRHQQGDDSGSRRDFEQAVQWNESAPTPDTMVYFLFAEFLLDKTAYPESLKYYERALARDSALTQARLGRAKCLLHLKEWKRAEDELKITAQAEDWRIESLNLLIKVYQAEEKTNEAQEITSQVEQLSAQQDTEKAERNRVASLLQNAHGLEVQKQFPQAVQTYQKLVREHADATAAWLGLGRCYAQLGQLDNAEHALHRIIELEENSLEAHALLGKVLLREQKIQKARGEFIHAEQIDPLFAEARLGVAASYVMEQRYPLAIETLRAAKSMGAGVEASLMLTEALYKNGQRDAALKEINDTIRRQPHNQEALAMRDSLLQERR